MTLAAAAPRGLTGSDRALMFALANLARSGATRSGYVSGIPQIGIGGIWTGAGAAQRVLIASLTINDQLNEAPNTCSFTVQGSRPVEGAEVTITLGSQHGAPLFAGSIVRVTETYAAQNTRVQANVLWQVECIDWTWRLNQRLCSYRYLTQSANAIATDLFTRFAPPGYQLVLPEPLPLIDEISLTNVPLMEAFAQLAQRIGGYAACDYSKVIRLWLTDAGAAPTPLTAAHPSLEALTYTRDLSQIVTRALVEGGGVSALSDVPLAETRIPVDDVAWYQAGGGRLVSGPQRLTYTGTVAGGGGATVGPGVAPTAAPLLALQAGAGLAAGTYRYAYTWVSASGETLPSAIGTITPGPVANPTAPPRQGYQGPPHNGALSPGQQYRFKYAWQTDTAWPPASVTLASPYFQLTASAAGYAAVEINYPSDPSVKRIAFYRTQSGGGGPFYLDSVWTSLPSPPNPSTVLVQGSTRSDADLVIGNYREPTSNTTGAFQVLVSGIATGPSGTTARKVYRSTVNGAGLQLLTTLSGNSATALPAADVAADATLGAAAPTVDTSGLTQTGGQVLPGVSSLIVSSTAPFGAEGWALVANQVIRYRGASGTTLTGIPASGAGAITSVIGYGAEIVVAPQVIGIPTSGAGALVFPLKQGDPVNLIVIVDDAAAQAAHAARVGGDGIVEGLLIDNRISEAEARSRALALLAQKKDPQITLRYRVRDPQTRSGVTVTVAIDFPLYIDGAFKIQDVRISGFVGRPAVYPSYDATASSQRFTFEDLLRQVRTRTRTQPS
jgi:hypothetical protein